jgi:hypothetical protein
MSRKLAKRYRNRNYTLTLTVTVCIAGSTVPPAALVTYMLLWHHVIL